MAGLRTEFEFTLPFGYVDNEGNLHRDGVMRMATAMDEIAPLRDPRVRNNQAYLTIILLARVISRLGGLSGSAVTTDVIEKLFANDLAYLQSFYNDVNSGRLLNRGSNVQETGEVSCPACGHHFTPEHNHSAGNNPPNQEAELIATGGL